MSERFTFTIHGKPFAKQRARFSRVSARAYTPKTTVSFENTVRQIAAQECPEPITGPVRLTVIATFEIPKSWSKKKAAEHIHRPHTQSPDLDNIIKAVSDGMNRIAFVDDKQIAADGGSLKMWGHEAKTEVIVEGFTHFPITSRGQG